MFLTELSPLMRECLAQPIAFAGGLVTGALRMNPEAEPVRSWLAKQGTTVASSSTDNGKSSTGGPQSIEID